MNTAPGTQCPRSAPPQQSKLDLGNTHTNTPMQHNSTSMTWQQMDEFPQHSKPYKNYRNRPQKKQWHNDNKKEAPIAATEGDKHAPVKVTTSKPTPPTTTTHLSQDKSAYNANHVPKEANTVVLHAEYMQPRVVLNEYIPPHERKHYIPPHLRNPTPANGAEGNPTNVGGAANPSPASSATTKPELTAGRTTVREVTPPSPTTTPCEPAKQGKQNAAEPGKFCNVWDESKVKQAITIRDKPKGKQRVDTWKKPTIKQRASAWDQLVPVNQPIALWDDETSVTGPTAPNEPTATNEPAAVNQPTAAKQPPAANKFRNPRRPRRSKPYKKHVWPKNKDMKYIPTNDDGGVEWKSDSGGDPDYDVKKLLDWNGDWLPPPESWCARRMWDDRHFGEHIDQWRSGLAPEIHGVVYYPVETFNPEQGPCKELAPRGWLQARVEGTNLRESWKIISAAQPKPLDDDVINTRPWWELYEDVVYTQVVQKGDQESQIQHPSPYLNTLPVPEAKLDLTASDNIGTPRYLLSAADRMLQLKESREEERRRHLAAIRGPIIKRTAPPVITVEDRSLHPRLNIYLRPVQAADVAGIMEIYNWYIERTIYAPEFDTRTEGQMRQRINVITNAGLPYLVAILKKTPSKPTPGYVSEKLVGWINLDDYCSQSSLFRYTFEMELFVHPGYRSKGIAKCLMDKLLDLADTSYHVRGGYEYVNDYEYLKSGPRRVIKTILVNCHHENGEDADQEWQGKFFNFCKFHRVGRLPKVGYKNGKVVDVSTYAHHTKEDIDPEVRPAVKG